MFTPAASPRLFEFLTTLTFGTLRSNHFVLTAFETTAKKRRQGMLFVHMRSAFYQELTRPQPKLEEKCVSVGVDALAVAS